MTSMACAALFVVCSSLGGLGDAVKLGVGSIGGSLPGGGAVTQAIDLAEKANDAYGEKFAPAEEFYLGRKVAAQVLGAYPKRLPQDSPVTQYVSKVGTTLALGSHAAYPYRPYTFVVLDTTEVNAFAAPGGIVFVTTGLLKFLDSEDAFAGVLAHEIGHVELRHGVRTIEKGGQVDFAKSAVGVVASQASSALPVPGVVGQLTDAAIDQSFKGVKDGYDVDLEAEADARSVEICFNTGYAPKVFLEVLQRFESGSHSYGGARYPKDRAGRAGQLMSKLAGADAVAPASVRTERYQAVKKLLEK